MYHGNTKSWTYRHRRRRIVLFTVSYSDSFSGNNSLGWHSLSFRMWNILWQALLTFIVFIEKLPINVTGFLLNLTFGFYFAVIRLLTLCASSVCLNVSVLNLGKIFPWSCWNYDLHHWSGIILFFLTQPLTKSIPHAVHLLSLKK